MLIFDWFKILLKFLHFQEQRKKMRISYSVFSKKLINKKVQNQESISAPRLIFWCKFQCLNQCFIFCDIVCYKFTNFRRIFVRIFSVFLTITPIAPGPGFPRAPPSEWCISYQKCRTLNSFKSWNFSSFISTCLFVNVLVLFCIIQSFCQHHPDFLQ